MRLRYLLILFAITLSFCGIALAETKVIENSGFVPGNLWFSKVPTAVGEKVQVYTLVWNGSTDDISGTVSFFDNDAVISKQDFVLAGSGSTKILSTTWAAGEGYHKIYAQITDSQGGPRGSKAVSVSLRYAKTVEEEHFVSAPVAPKATSSGVTGMVSNIASNIVDQKVDYATGYLEANLPTPVVGATKAVTSGLESVRTSAQAWTGNEISKLKSGLASTTSKEKKDDALADKTDAETSDSGFSVEGPFKYAALAFLSAGNYIFGNGWLFYGLGLIIIFFIFSFIKRKFFY